MSDGIAYHPRLRCVTRTGLSEDQRQAHKAAGWRLTPIPADRVGDEPESPAPSGGDDVIVTTDATSAD